MKYIKNKDYPLATLTIEPRGCACKVFTHTATMDLDKTPHVSVNWSAYCII